VNGTFQKDYLGRLRLLYERIERRIVIHLLDMFNESVNLSKSTNTYSYRYIESQA